MIEDSGEFLEIFGQIAPPRPANQWDDRTYIIHTYKDDDKPADWVVHESKALTDLLSVLVQIPEVIRRKQTSLYNCLRSLHNLVQQGKLGEIKPNYTVRIHHYLQVVMEAKALPDYYMETWAKQMWKRTAQAQEGAAKLEAMICDIELA